MSIITERVPVTDTFIIKTTLDLAYFVLLKSSFFNVKIGEAD